MIVSPVMPVIFFASARAVVELSRNMLSPSDIRLKAFSPIMLFSTGFICLRRSTDISVVGLLNVTAPP
ncbi:MAG: hypothetical protein BWY60_01134 [Actinobacteria bacterium ADurb.Bin346]|nr:MAG: hypothetical protein BWY60_01134 [Actinobacteria bacterium ADurb.Bin346]